MKNQSNYKYVDIEADITTVVLKTWRHVIARTPKKLQ